MGDETKIPDVIRATEGLFKAVPIYQDLLQPTAKELGKALETTGKTINLVLSPLRATVWGYEKIGNFVKIAVSARLKRLSPEAFSEPNPTIAGPALEALRFSGHDPVLRELYANLLASSIDRNTAKNCHPAFVEILKQLSPDEARLLQGCTYSQSRPWLNPTNNWCIPFVFVDIMVGGEKKISYGPPVCHIPEMVQCDYPELLEQYLINLQRLSLIEIKGSFSPIDIDFISLGNVTTENLDNQREAFWQDLQNKARKEWEFAFDALEDKSYEEEWTRDSYRLSDFGGSFYKACVMSIEH